jgi:hypothetical protein
MNRLAKMTAVFNATPTATQIIPLTRRFRIANSARANPDRTGSTADHSLHLPPADMNSATPPAAAAETSSQVRCTSCALTKWNPPLCKSEEKSPADTATRSNSAVVLERSCRELFPG